MQVQFRIKKAQTAFGQNLFVVGSSAELSSWNPSKAIVMNTNSSLYPQWQTDKVVFVEDDDQQIEYKYIIKSNQNQIIWEEGPNRILDLTFFDDSAKVIIEDEAFNVKGRQKIINTSIDNGQDIQITEDPIDYEPSQDLSKGEDFKQNTTTDISVQDMIQELKELDEKRGTWKQKLEVVAELVERHKHDKSFSSAGLSLLAAYLYFVNSHQIKCAENGTHFRPNHHAGIAYQLYLTLDKELTNDSNSFIIRNLKRNLPSFADQFTASVPLTRIRDIAHRNDIPQDLKQDIKHRLQNKLHRCADPGDLKTCEEIIQRVRNGDYSGGFKHEFEIFYEELKEFFNAVGLDKLLQSISGNSQSEDSLKNSINEFLNLKYHNQLGDLSPITSLRKLLQQKLVLIFDNPSQKTLNQLLQLADIELEQFLFVKLSEQLSQSNQDIQQQIKLSLVAIDNMILSKLYQNEFGIIKHELVAFGLADQRNKLEQLRFKSTLDKCLRLSTIFTTHIAQNFQSNVIELGKSFGIDRHSVEVFSESFIRSHLIFQFTKSIESLLASLRKSLNLPPYIVISPGTFIIGKVRYCKSIYEVLSDQKHEQYLIFLENADGTEEFPLNVKGVILRHDLPQLSHLAIRARQQGCIFVACENESAFVNLKKQAKELQFAKLSLKNEALIIESAKASDQQSDENQATQLHQEETKLSIDNGTDEILLQRLHDRSFTIENEIMQSNEAAEVSLLGSKSVNSSRLQQIAKKNDYALFQTPLQFTIPMTIPLYFLNSSSSIQKQYSDLLIEIDNCEYSDIKSLREAMLEFLHNLYYNECGQELSKIAEILQKQLSTLPNQSLVAVRSSSTLEDLAKMAGAGLFDSYLNITLNDSEQLIKSIVDVWLSIFTERAIVSRKQYHIKGSQAHMSVLIQQQIHSDFSFIIHSQNPVNSNPGQAYIEIAVGLGETLASANQQGTPYRLVYDKKKDQCEIQSFASYSQGLFASQETKESIERLVDYSQIEFTTKPEVLSNIGKRLGNIAIQIEKAYQGQAQDIEGAIVTNGDEYSIYVVQTRNQV